MEKDPNQTIPTYRVGELIIESLQARLIFKDRQLTKEMRRYKWTHSKYKRR